MTKEYGGGDGTSEGGEIRRDVVHRGNESLVHDMGHRYEDTTSEGHRQQEAHHDRSLTDAPQDQPPPMVARAAGRTAEQTEGGEELAPALSWSVSVVVSVAALSRNWGQLWLELPARMSEERFARDADGAGQARSVPRAPRRCTGSPVTS